MIENKEFLDALRVVYSHLEKKISKSKDWNIKKFSMNDVMNDDIDLQLFIRVYYYFMELD